MSQSITHDLRRWIQEQTRAGLVPSQLLKSMQVAGWHAQVAAAALAKVLPDSLEAAGLLRQLTEGIGGGVGGSAEALSAQPLAQPSAAGPAQAASAGINLPRVDLSRSPSRLDLGDRQVQVLASLTLPRLVVLGGFLSDEECRALVAAAQPRMARSLTVETKSGGEEVNVERTSQGMFFALGESELIKAIEARIARLLHWPVENGEGLQVLHYRVGAEYRPHYDYFDPTSSGTPSILRRGGQRVGTLLMYLNEPVGGGGTTFPDASLEVAPQRGNAVFFSYDQASPATRSLHGGAPVTAGEKWIATKWLREGEFH